MRSLRSLFLALAVVCLPLLTGCGGGVATGPAPVDPATMDEDSTSGMTDEEVEEFEAGEGG